MPHLLQIKGQKGWQFMHSLIIYLLMFLQPFLKSVQMNEPIRKLYKGTLRILLVLLHDFPEFLCEYHLSLCEAIPVTCVQLRNLVLSAFPRQMRLPDPFTPNLKVDTLPEISVSPRILTDYISALNDRGLRARLDSYLASKQPTDVPSQAAAAVVASSGGGYNLPLITSIVVYVSAQAISIQQAKGAAPSAIQNSPAIDIFKQLLSTVDLEGRYHILNAMANQLRYPNNQTHFFSCTLLLLFSEAEEEFLQEQITRVLLERLIVHRPHPWGLLVTFIELIKNPKYAFWRHSFAKCDPEIEKVFESVSRTCMGPAASTVAHQQLQQHGHQQASATDKSAITSSR